MRIIIFIIFCFLIPAKGLSQQNQIVLTFDEVIDIAREQSLQAIITRHRFRGNYWEYRTHVARFRPSLNFSGTLLNYNRSIEQEFDAGREVFVAKNQNNAVARLSLNQNIGLTGGELSVNTNLRRFDVFGSDGYTEYVSVPTNIEYVQPTIIHNPLKWEQKIEPLKYEQAKRNYLSNMEQVSIRATALFFDLALAQINHEIAKVNYASTDTLFRIAQGRYNIGTIAENELLQMELGYLNAGLNLNEAIIQLEMKKAQLRSYLGFNETVEIEIIVPTDIPELKIDVSLALSEAIKNNPEMLGWERQLLEAERDLDRSRAEKGFNANVFARYGLTQRAEDFPGAYADPLSQQGLSIGMQIPIVDWGLGRGRYKMAEYNQEVIRTSVEQSRIDFEQDIIIQVMQFNLQDDQLLISAKADTIAQSRYEVTKQRFFIGRISVLDLNVALSEKDVARRNYVSSLRNYWNYYYNLRRLTLYDFVDNQPILERFDELID